MIEGTERLSDDEHQECQGEERPCSDSDAIEGIRNVAERRTDAPPRHLDDRQGPSWSRRYGRSGKTWGLEIASHGLDGHP